MTKEKLEHIDIREIGTNVDSVAYLTDLKRWLDYVVGSPGCQFLNKRVVDLGWISKPDLTLSPRAGAYGNGMFVVSQFDASSDVSQIGQFFYSDTGEIWKQTHFDIDFGVRGMCYQKSQTRFLVATGATTGDSALYGRLYAFGFDADKNPSQPIDIFDAVHGTMHSQGLFDVCAANDAIVVVGNPVNTPNEATAEEPTVGIWYSTNGGTTWNHGGDGIENSGHASIGSVCCNEDASMIICGRRDVRSTDAQATGAPLYYSLNYGKDWTPCGGYGEGVELPTGEAGAIHIRYYNGTWIAVPKSNASFVLVSHDGMTFSKVDLPNTTEYGGIEDVAFAGGMWVALLKDSSSDNNGLSCYMSHNNGNAWRAININGDAGLYGGCGVAITNGVKIICFPYSDENVASAVLFDRGVYGVAKSAFDAAMSMPSLMPKTTIRTWQND